MDRSLAIDFGGVLTTSVRDAFRAFCEREGVDEKHLHEILRAAYIDADPDTLVSRFEAGLIEDEEFERELAAGFSIGLHQPIAAAGLLDRMSEDMHLVPEMIDGVRRIHDAGVRTALLSNAWGLDVYPRDVIAEVFDVVVISREVGMRKPDAEIFTHTVQLMEMPADHIVFVDDAPPNIAAAERAGMIGVLHSEPSQTLARLDELLLAGHPSEDPLLR